MQGPNYIAFAIPLFFILISIELLVAWRKRRTVYHFADAITDLACGISQQLARVFLTVGLLAVYTFVYERFRLVTFPAGSAWPWVIALFGVDFLYYWWHRLSHQVNFLWAIHVVHHSSEDFNLAVALRQAVFSLFSTMPFYVLLAVAGVPTIAFATMESLSLLYQFWIHTELMGSWGRGEGLMNSPSAHRVHHAVNARYLDRNFAATFLIWDRLFGSYEPEGEPCVYGITKPLKSFNPFWAQVHYWRELFDVARAAPSLAQGLSVPFRSPSWHPQWTPAPEPRAEPLTPQSFVRHAAPSKPALNVYIGVHFALVVVATFCVSMWGAMMSPAPRGVPHGDHPALPVGVGRPARRKALGAERRAAASVRGSCGVVSLACGGIGSACLGAPAAARRGIVAVVARGGYAVCWSPVTRISSISFFTSRGLGRHATAPAAMLSCSALWPWPAVKVTSNIPLWSGRLETLRQTSRPDISSMLRSMANPSGLSS